MFVVVFVVISFFFKAANNFIKKSLCLTQDFIRWIKVITYKLPYGRSVFLYDSYWIINLSYTRCTNTVIVILNCVDFIINYFDNAVLTCFAVYNFVKYFVTKCILMIKLFIFKMFNDVLSIITNKCMGWFQL